MRVCLIQLPWLITVAVGHRCPSVLQLSAAKQRKSGRRAHRDDEKEGTAHVAADGTVRSAEEFLRERGATGGRVCGAGGA